MDDVPELNGSIERKSEGWLYEFEIVVSAEQNKEFTEIDRIREDLKKREQDWRNSVAFTAKRHLPPSWQIRSVGQCCYGKVKCFAIMVGATFKEKEKPTAPIVSKTPQEKEAELYQQISNRHDFKQILGSGILSKREKRLCLGLPDEEKNAEQPAHCAEEE